MLNLCIAYEKTPGWMSPESPRGLHENDPDVLLKMAVDADDMNLATRLVQEGSFDPVLVETFCIKGNTKILGVYFEHFPADMNKILQPDKGSQTLLLQIAAAKSTATMVEFLLEKNALPDAVGISDHTTPLAFAISREHSGVVAVLLEHGASMAKCQDMPGNIERRLFNIKDSDVFKQCIKHMGSGFCLDYMHELLRACVVQGRREHVAIMLRAMRKFYTKEGGCELRSGETMLLENGGLDENAKELAIRAGRFEIYEMLKDLPEQATGRMWHNIGSEPPETGTELFDAKLVKLLQDKTILSQKPGVALEGKIVLLQQELNRVVVGHFRKDDYVKSGDSYFVADDRAVRNFAGEDLRRAAASGSVDMVWHFLRTCNPRDVDENGRNAVFFALQNGHSETARVMLEELCDGRFVGRNVDKPDHCGARPLFMAVLLQQHEIVSKILLLKEHDDATVKYALARAQNTDMPNPRMIKVLLDASTKGKAMPYAALTRDAFKASVDATKMMRDFYGNIAEEFKIRMQFDHALCHHDMDKLWCLLSKDWDAKSAVRALEARPLSWLTSGSSASRAQVVRLMVRCGFVVSIEVWLTLCTKNNCPILKYLTLVGVDVNWSDVCGTTGLICACQAPDIAFAVVKTLMALGADINAKNLHEDSPFAAYVSNSRLDSVNANVRKVLPALLDAKADIWSEQVMQVVQTKKSTIHTDWCNVGTEPPAGGTGLHNAKLSELLARKTILSMAEINSAKVSGVLTSKTYIKSGPSYFMMIPLGIQMLREYIARERMVCFLFIKREVAEDMLKKIFRLTLDTPSIFIE